MSEQSQEPQEEGAGEGGEESGDETKKMVDETTTTHVETETSSPSDDES